MAKEIELKLSVGRYHVEALKQQPLFLSKQISDLGAKPLKNIYFDTPEHHLSQHRVALRIREKEGQYIQTLKTSGISEAGLHQRQEWEWTVPTPELDFELLNSVEWPEALNDPELLAQIEPVFCTDFMRQTWLFDGFDDKGEKLRIEIALDQGQAWIDDNGDRKHDEIRELELELLEGRPVKLFDVALQLGQQIPLLSSDVSKAERGYRLSRPEQFEIEVPEVTYSDEDTMEDAFCRLVHRELTLWPQYLEAWQRSRDWTFVTQALESLRNISALYESFNEIIPAHPDGELDQMLTKLIRQLRDVDAWHRSAQLMGEKGQAWQEAAAKRGEERMEVLLQTVSVGQIALRIARQMVVKRWRRRWTDEHRERAERLFNAS